MPSAHVTAGEAFPRHKSPHNPVVRRGTATIQNSRSNPRENHREMMTFRKLEVQLDMAGGLTPPFGDAADA